MLGRHYCPGSLWGRAGHAAHGGYRGSGSTHGRTNATPDAGISRRAHGNPYPDANADSRTQSYSDADTHRDAGTRGDAHSHTYASADAYRHSYTCTAAHSQSNPIPYSQPDLPRDSPSCREGKECVEEHLRLERPSI